MASKVLPQALITIPTNPTQCPAKKLGFCSAVSRRSCSLSSARVSISSSFGSNLGPLVTKRGFAVRAEPEETVAEEGEGNVVSESEEASRPPWKPRVKLGDVMGILNKRAVEAAEKVRPIPDIRTGDIVQIKLEVPENKRRLSIYKGIVMSRQNAGIHTTIRVRRIIAGVGVEIVFPLYSPNIKEILVVNHRKVRRARLYYLRDKLPRFSTFK